MDKDKPFDPGRIKKRADVARILINKGANINWQDSFKQQLLCMPLLMEKKNL
jgi:hypothetical protein